MLKTSVRPTEFARTERRMKMKQYEHPEQYRDLKELLADDRTAYAYFTELPQNVREQLSDCGDTIHTGAELRQCADRILGGRL